LLANYPSKNGVGLSTVKALPDTYHFLALIGLK